MKTVVEQIIRTFALAVVRRTLSTILLLERMAAMCADSKSGRPYGRKAPVHNPIYRVLTLVLARAYIRLRNAGSENRAVDLRACVEV